MADDDKRKDPLIRWGSIIKKIREDSKNSDKPPVPLPNVGVIMNQNLPAGGKISKEAKDTLQECAAEFISFVTEEACLKCHNDKREIVNGDDIRWVLSSSEAVFKYFHKYGKRESERIAGSRQDSNEEENIDLNLLFNESEDQSKESGIVPNEIPVLDHMEPGREDLANESRTPVEIDSGNLGEANDSEDLPNKRRTPKEFDFGIVDKGKKPRN